MKELYKQQAHQLYEALYAKKQTWTRSDAVLNEWAEQFQELGRKYRKHRKRITRLLDWYCQDGCGAIYVPLVGNAETFCQKFQQLDLARNRLKGQPLRYFNDVIKYKITPRKTGSKAQKEHAEVVQRLQQQVELIDALAHKRVTLPVVKPVFTTNGHATPKVKYSPFLAKARKTMTKRQQAQLDALLNVDRELLWQLIMQVPNNQNEWHDHLERNGFWKPFGDYFKPNRKQEAAERNGQDVDEEDDEDDDDWESPFHETIKQPRGRNSVAMRNGRA